jgi:hypothetical protein
MYYVNFKILKANAFENLELIELRIFNSNMRQIDVDFFKGAKVEKLRLKWNELTDLAFLRNLQGLKFIEIYKNTGLDQFKASSFLGLTDLNFLEFGENSIGRNKTTTGLLISIN